MSENHSPSMQFDRADFGAVAPSRVICSSCSNEVVQSYYTVGDRLVCSHCRERVQQEGGGLLRFFRATGAGLLVALAGAVVWWGVRAMTNYEIGLISIGIGIAVARAIMWGTGGRTNVMYRILAVLITYTGIALNYAPDVAKGLAEGQPIRAVHVLVGVIMSFTVPFFGGAENILGYIIIAFGLWEAWKLTRPTQHDVAGPFSVAAAAPTNA